MPLILLKQFGSGQIEKREIAHSRTKKEVFLNVSEEGMFLVADNGTYPELERRFLLFGSKDDYESDEDPYLMIQVLGRLLERHQEKRDLYQDRVEFSGVPSGVISFLYNPIICLSCRILTYSAQLMKSPGFKVPKYRVKHEANYPVIVSYE